MSLRGDGSGNPAILLIYLMLMWALVKGMLAAYAAPAEQKKKRR